MRKAMIIALALATAGCALPQWLHSVGHFFWDAPKPKPAYCIVSLEPADANGISVPGHRAKAVELGCEPPRAAGQLPRGAGTK